ncbi:MAG: tRNA pseudouridine(13) synthase TruD [Planctomycetes bacterium]|nr:tRNA pseudouridine(13) synthase TruD [Planctomycetota bacterium]
MTEPSGEAAAIEAGVLAHETLKTDDFRALARMKIHGARRPIRFRPEELAIESGSDEHGPFAELRFSLASGCYATLVLGEICKQSLEEGLEEE